MLIEFKVANYRSIRAEQTLSMVASNSEELPQNLISCDHVPGLKGTNLVKAVALYGANASGKSNIVAALRFFAEFVRDSATKLQPGAPTGAQPFKLDPKCLTEPSKFEVTAVINGIRTLYGIEMTRERVTSEYLVAYPKARPQVWFERDWDDKKGKYAWSKSTAHFKHDEALHERTRENAAFVSVAAQFNHKEVKELLEWLNTQLECPNVEERAIMAIQASGMLKDNFCRKLLIPILKSADLGVAEVLTRKPTVNEHFRSYAHYLRGLGDSADDGLPYKDGERLPDEAEIKKSLANHLVPEFLHHASGGVPKALNFFREESLGTQRFTALMAEIVLTRELNNLLVIDELETGLHPKLARDAIAVFLSPVFTQPKLAQLIFTTHNPLLLDQTLLRRDQIWFTEKDHEGATRLYPLTDFKPRKDESLVKGYLAGRYGGIPFIPEGLTL